MPNKPQRTCCVGLAGPGGRLEPFKKLAKTLKDLDGVVRGMLDNRSNAYVEAMNGLLQQAACRQGLQDRKKLYCHCLSAHVQTQELATQPIATRPATSGSPNP